MNLFFGDRDLEILPILRPQGAIPVKPFRIGLRSTDERLHIRCYRRQKTPLSLVQIDRTDQYNLMVNPCNFAMLERVSSCRLHIP